MPSNIDAHIALNMIKMVTKQRVKMMGKMLNGFAAINVNLYHVFCRNCYQTSLALEKTGSVVMHDTMYIFN